MIAYITLGTNDIERAGKFYDALLGEVGAGRAMESDRFIGWATGPGQPMVAVIKPFDEQPATAGNGMMTALAAENPAAVDRLYAKALELGGTDEGPPGVRADAFYIGYFRDLDGNKLNFFCAKDA
jgi:catechol 2,3-dioxygenase-like lactoylglutathione lyase family enzyme